MPTLKLSKNAIAKLPAPDPSGRQTLHWDTELKGFGVLISGTTTTKTYIVQHTLAGGSTRRMTIGPVNALDLEGEGGARAKAKALIGLFYNGIDPKAEQRKKREEAAMQAKGTLAAMLDAYLEKNKKLAANTRAYYRRVLERHLQSWLHLPLADITADMVEDRHAEIAKEIAAANVGSRRGGGPTTGEATANLAMNLFSIIWGFAAEPRRMPHLGPSPTRVLKRQWFENVRRDRLVTGDQLPAFYKAVDRLENRIVRDYILLMLFTGLRRREAASLRWTDIDFSSRLIRLPATRTKSGRKLDLPMSSFVRDLLIARRAIGRDGDFVFPANSKSGYVEDVSFALSLVAKATGIQICAHDLRRTFITNAEATDMSAHALKALVNHALPERDVTAGYVQMTVERLRQPAQRVCDRLIELCKITPPQAENVAQLG